MKNKLAIILAVLVLAFALVIGCSPEDEATNGEETANGEEEVSNGEEERDELSIAYGNWACTISKTYVVKDILEEELGYDVDLTMADIGAIYESVANQGSDMFVGAYLPHSHEAYVEERGDDLENLGPIFDNARIGMVVPEYVEFDSIEEIGDYYDEFDGEIVGIEPGGGVMESTASSIENYDSLDGFELVSSSEQAMVASLGNAIENEEYIAVTGWIPHWKFSQWELKFLEDPRKEYGEIERIDVITRQGLKDDFPEVGEFLENINFTDEQLGEVMTMIEETEDEEGSAREWVENNRDVVESWLP